MTAGCPNRQRRHTPSSWTTPNPDTTLLGLYFQQPARRAVKVNKRAQGSFGYLIRPPPAMYPALRSLPSCAPINRDHAREHERKSEFYFEVGNETRNPRR